MKRWKPVTALVVVLLSLATAANAQVLKAVRDRGALNCGVSEGLYGFSARDNNGNWSGFDVDMCRAIAAAIFNDVSKVNYVPLDATRRFEALQSGNIDVLSRNTTWTMSREIELGLTFAATSYYDGQGFLVPRAMSKETALDLDGAKICVQTGTTTELNLVDFFGANKMKYEAVTSPTLEAAIKGYDSGQCNVLTADVSALFGIRLLLSKPDEHAILPDVISKEPLGPVVRQDDPQWFNIVKWVHFAMVNAEELGVTSKNIDEALKSEKPDVRRLVGTEGSYGERMGLTKDWAARVIKLVGNYGEVYERTVGVGSPLVIPRGINQLWSKGGILYAPPIR
ncbi:MAG TPA: amino acid ABC transporter substrate-binding protein [Pseudolabrys sp.]|nr:amino acid ABC transporter substrate-binding protein [Pseudolabrys sp.]